MTSSPVSLEDTISRLREIIAEFKKLPLSWDTPLYEYVTKFEAKIEDVDAGKYEEDYARELRVGLRGLEKLFLRVTQPQYQIYIAEMIRHANHDSPEFENFMDFLHRKPLGNRDNILLDYCNILLDELMCPQITYKVASASSRNSLGYCTGYRPDDEILNQYIRQHKLELERIKRYFLMKESERTLTQDKIFSRELLVLQRDISQVLVCVRSRDSINVSKTIDDYQKSGKQYQADLILDALYATPLKDRRHLLSGPSLVKNALATNSDGTLHVEVSGNINFLKAPAAYRKLTGQNIDEIKHMNDLAPDENLKRIEYTVYRKIRPKIALGAKRKERSPDSASTAVTPDESVEEMFREVDTSPSITKQGLFKPIVPETTMVEKIKRSHDASGDITEEDLDKTPSSDEFRQKK